MPPLPQARGASSVRQRGPSGARCHPGACNFLSTSRKTIQTLAGHLLVYAQTFALTPIIIKASGPETYGAYVLLLSYLGLMYGISSIGVGISAKRWLPSTANFVERANRFYPQFWFQALSVATLGCLSAIVYANLDSSVRLKFGGLSAWIFPVYLLAYTVYSQSTDYFRYTHRTGVFNLATVGQPYLFISLSFGAYWATNTITASLLITSLTFASAITGGILFVRVCKEIGIQLKLFKRQDLVDEIRLGFPLVLGYMVEVILSGGDRYIIAVMLSVKDVGFYTPAYMIGSLTMVLPRVLGVVLPPLISQRVDAGDEIGAKALSENVASIFLIASIPYVIGAAVLGKELLQLYTNKEIAEGVWQVIPIVGAASIFYGLILIKSNILFVRLKTSALFQINLISAALNICLNIALIYLCKNVIVAAIATLASYSLSYILINQKYKEDSIDFSINSRALIRTIGCSLGMGLIMILMNELLKSGSWSFFCLKSLIGFVTYIILSYNFNQVEIYRLISIMMRRRVSS